MQLSRIDAHITSAKRCDPGEFHSFTAAPVILGQPGDVVVLFYIVPYDGSDPAHSLLLYCCRQGQR